MSIPYSEIKYNFPGSFLEQFILVDILIIYDEFMGTMKTEDIFKLIENDGEPDDAALKHLLELSDPAEIRRLYELAYAVKVKHVGRVVYFRGLLELSNICCKDCFYCGIRKSNADVKRFCLSKGEILKSVAWVQNNHYGSIVLQGGERSDEKFVEFIEEVLRDIGQCSDGRLGITLSLGEQTRETYRRWFDAGAHRYLLRIEASDPELYRKLHPEGHSYERRLECLRDLQDIGYQTGTGVMIGLPFQSLDNLVHDLRFFQEMNIDMIGMGPYLMHPQTPLADAAPSFDVRRQERLELGLKMIACARILLKDVNIASTTALQALSAEGRQLGLLAGANVVMPNVTDTRYRVSYQLYAGKPGLNENSKQSRKSLEEAILAIGEKVGYGETGTSKHYSSRHMTYAVIGYPVAHSLSPQMQNAAFSTVGLGSPYQKVEVPPDKLEEFVDTARSKLLGFNITVPHKERIIPFLDEVEESARQSSSVNTVVIRDGRLHGYSTDGYGLAMALFEAFGLLVPGSSILFLGCGGAVRAAAFSFAASGAAGLSFANRTLSKAEDLAAELKRIFPNLETGCSELSDRDRVKSLAVRSQAVIQGTILGLKPGDPLPVDPELIRGIPFFDTIYKQTPLLKWMREHGYPAADGRGMLLHQGARSFELWTGQNAPLKVMRKALDEAINGAENGHDT